jgi:hypothetical protein
VVRLSDTTRDSENAEAKAHGLGWLKGFRLVIKRSLEKMDEAPTPDSSAP